MKTYGAMFRISLCSVVIALAVSFMAESGWLKAWKAKATAADITLPTVILDAGHGGEDGGACGADGTLEKELNLSITQMLAALFRLAGYNVVETRTDDRLMYGADAQKGHKKQADLQNRLEIAGRYPNGILISIHMNSYPGADCRGLQVWYSHRNDAAAAYAQAVQSGVKALLQPDNNRKIKASTSGIYLLKNAPVPAILIECGFLSTQDECEKLRDKNYQLKLATAIFASLSQKIEENSCAETEVML